ncbi:MAG: replicative DNA helicase [Deltaproteobacteria bacterium CG12_big_fil_rev_8_21_14_0_65_43_10]|nr:MAG: replicative DNA helicase [Deltaproteobacteria bacterium CG2_30_43_15]PIQ45641.1 MAG: replicative DNA helicase [Deltaproteobacteria bacterium CG12_big_fil_rev_8_21_14_0_65_43_10]PIU85131.1 MAG: replicative DNA helicase [Deltaproteobacteria bacterium CG06_land_8_20_14_3_00_44_19]PIX23861.1 MAG: replicative DNA helicase [Deltaproteobacteria bacterium CG_4_8_14_3_um_filter_43_13]PIZ21102.1 MAG: replicative DNA helicase [Deltaproteobacteria bacterium CG_4_10_14_0_8_um_filter_43_12]PJB42875.
MVNKELSQFKLPPQNIEAEQSILGGILLDNEVFHRVLEVLNEDDFYHAAHRKVFLSMIELYENNEPVDLITLTNALKNKNQLDEIRGVSYLTSLVDSIPTTANISYYAKIVKEKSILRRLINKTAEIASMSYDSTGDVDEVLDQAERAIFEISENKIKPSFYSIKEMIKHSFKTIERLYEKKELITGVPTGFEGIDRFTSGFQLSDLVIIAGRPSMGKTSFALNIAQYAAIEASVPVGIFSLEMSKEQLSLRMLCSEAKVDAQRLRTGFLSESDWPKLTRAVGSLSEAPIFVDDTPALSILEMRAKARRLKSEKGLGLIIVDYLQLMRGRVNVERREQEISEISRSLKALAKELNLPVVALSQLNRRVEERHDKRPQLADLRESGAIEQDADVIIFIYRDEIYNKSEDNENKGTAEIIIGKQRNGPIGMTKLAFIDKFATFENLAPFTKDF